ncbi:MAG: redoxin domain-containing protein, partial [Anaerolineales bacterium]|nr:redoxin domain-containing protein [Anaerolineales bacterium]
MPSYQAEYARFTESNVQVLGISVDHIPALQAWAKSLSGISFPLLSDFWPHGEIAEKYGVLRSDGSSERAIFIIDKNGIIQYIDIHDIDDQPDNEVLFAELKRMDPDAFAE